MISINLDKAKSIAHDLRRARRAEEFAPYDAIIALRIPGQPVEDAETARREIRARYAKMQADIDFANTVSDLEFALGINR